MIYAFRYALLALIFSTIFYFGCGVAGDGGPNTNAKTTSMGGMPRNRVAGDLSVMVLGSGGPNANVAGRASAGYLIFISGEPTILMDVGGGTFQRLAASGTNIKDLGTILLSHLHIDHTGDLSSMIKTIFFHNRAAGTLRSTPVNIYGPDANGVAFPPVIPGGVAQYPSTLEYADGLYDANTGIERYLHIFSRAILGGVFEYIVSQYSPDSADPTINTLVSEANGLVVESIAVNHGPVPALAFRIKFGGISIVYSGDTTSKTDNMITLAKNADLLIYDTAIMSDTPAPFINLHTTPERIGQVAAAANVDTLLLSHITPITEPNLDLIIDTIRAQGFTGYIEVAEDLEVINVDYDSSSMIHSGG